MSLAMSSEQIDWLKSFVGSKSDAAVATMDETAEPAADAACDGTGPVADAATAPATTGTDGEPLDATPAADAEAKGPTSASETEPPQDTCDGGGAAQSDADPAVCSSDDPEGNTGRGGSGSDGNPATPPTAGDGVSAEGAPVERVVLGMAQRERAAENMAKMSPEDHAKVTKVLETAAAQNPDQVDYVAKALAAGHSTAEVEAFQKEIAGRDKAWMDEHLHLVGSSTGHGIKQQWSHSCAPTEVEAMKGELDPIYAMQLRKANPHLDQADDKDASKVNPALANEQFNLLTQGGGNAAPRENADGSGHGVKMSKLLNSEGSVMGMQFDRKEIGSDATMGEALDTAQEKLKGGLPVPISVGDDSNPYAHAAMMTGVDPGPPRRFSIHDPWTGSTKTYSEDDIRSGKLDVGSCKKIAAIYPPSRT